MSITVEIRLADLLSDEERETIANLRARIDNGMPAWILGFQWAPLVWRTIVWVDGKITGHVGIVQREIDVGGQLVNVGGIGGVWTVPEARGQGLASTAVMAATEFMRDELRASFGLLVCRDQLEPFYQRLGWNRVEVPMVFDQPFGKVTWPLRTMMVKCAKGQWPEGAIALNGPPW